MKKLLSVSLLLVCLLWIAPPSFAAAETPSSGPLRICFWPGVWYWPADQNIYGLSLGLGNYNSKDSGNIVAGLDLGIISMTDNVKGLRLSVFNNGENAAGVEIGVANISKNVSGVQVSILNQAADSSFFQLGLVNQSTKGKGVQIGLINMMDNGFFPIFPIINWGFEKKY